METQDKQNTDLEGRILRDKIANVGLKIGLIGGSIYWLSLGENENASLIQSLGTGALMGSGVSYCLGTAVKYIKKNIKKYKKENPKNLQRNQYLIE